LTADFFVPFRQHQLLAQHYYNSTNRGMESRTLKQYCVGAAKLTSGLYVLK
jgi:hypothetical protein